MLPGRLALLGEGGRASRRRHEVNVAAAAHATRGHDHALAGMREVGDLVEGLLRAWVELADDRAQRDPEDEVLSPAAVLAGALAVRAALGVEVMLVAVIDERGELGVGLDDDVAAMAPVASVRPALWDERLAPERHAPGTAVTAAYVDV